MRLVVRMDFGKILRYELFTDSHFINKIGVVLLWKYTISVAETKSNELYNKSHVKCTGLGFSCFE